jgi:hypothetical protein
MFYFLNKSIIKNELFQKYIDESTKKSIQKKIDNQNNEKKSILYLKNPISCELNYLKSDYDWSKEELFKYCKLTKEYLKKKNMKNNTILPFCFYFLITGSFFIFEYGS